MSKNCCVKWAMRYLWWMCRIYAILNVWNVYMLYFWWMWLLHNKQKKNSKLCRLLLPWHSAKQPFFYFLEKGFAECNYFDTQRSLKLCRVPDAWHSANIQTSPSADLAALGKARNFAECCQLGTRRSLNLCRVPRVWYSAKFQTSPSPFASLPVRPSRFNFFCRVRLNTRQRFAECPRKGTRQSRLRR